MALVTCVDVGSTFTKGVLVDLDSGAPLATASHPTTIASDVLRGLDAVCRELSAHGPVGDPLVCSSAGGGLRIAVVGQELEVSAQAGLRVALSAGGRVVSVSAGVLAPAGIRELRGHRPDLVLLVGGTDGGNENVLLDNAAALARARVAAPVVVAGNAEVSQEATDLLLATGRRAIRASNVIPRIGVIAPQDARAAIREAFLRHVIGGKGLSRGPRFADLVQAATPDAVLSGVEVLAAALGGDVLVVDIGGATTDVYSVITPQGEDATIHREVVAPLWQARTVEADLGMRWNAEGIVEAAARESIAMSEPAARHAARMAADPSLLASTPGDWAAEEELARAAALIAVRRHARPSHDSQAPRPLTEVALVLGSGGVLRHSPAGLAQRVLDGIRSDHAGGWRVPSRARAAVDTAYLLFAVGLLAPHHPETAGRLARHLVG